MGYPVINRLGTTQFWYKHWQPNTNLNFKENLQHDIIFQELLKFYINYGLTTKINFFFNEYWYSKNKKKNRFFISDIKTNKFYRRYYYTNFTLSIEHSFFIRHQIGEYFPLRVWILKYSGWIILSFKCFKPLKSKYSFSSQQKKTKLQNSKPILALNAPSIPMNLKLKFSAVRLKIFYFFLKRNYNKYFKQYYKF